MPALTGSELDLYRSASPVLDYYLAIMPRLVVFACSLNDAGADWGDWELPYDNVTQGAWGNIEAGHTMTVYDSTGTTNKGKVRVRSANASQITVGANNDIDWENNDLLTVYHIFEPWSRPTNMVDSGDTITYYKDWSLTWASNNETFRPKANGGVAWAGFLNGGYADVEFDAAESFPVAPGASIASYSWDLEDGAFQVGGAATPQITARFSTTGFRWVRLTVTDDNGETGLHRIPVWTFGGGYQPLTNFEIKRRVYDVRDGELQVEGFETDLGYDDVPEGTQVVLFTREYIDNVEVTDDLGCPFVGRRQIRFVGWILKDSIQWDPDTGYVAFTVGTLGKIADQLPGYGTFLQDVDTPTNWHEASGLTARMAIFFLLRWHTNLLGLAHMELITYDDADGTPDIAGRKFLAAPPFKQIEGALLYGRGLFVRIGCSRWGSVHMRYDPQERNAANRNTRATVMNLLETDLYEEIRLERSTRPRVSSVFGGGIYYDGTDGTPYRSRSPGLVGREAPRRERMDNLIINDQVHLNNLLGRFLAATTNEWDNVPLETMYDVFEPALQEYVTFDVDAVDNPREFTFADGTRWIVRRATIEDEPGDTPKVTIEVELLTTEFAGVTVAIPDPPSYPFPEFPGPRPLPVPDPGYPEGIRLLAATDGAGMIMTGDLDAAFPIWEYIGTALQAEDIIDFDVDPDDNRRVVCLVKDAGFGSTSTGSVWVIDDYRTGEWVKVLDGTTAWNTIEATEGTIDDAEAWQVYAFTGGHILVGVSYDIGIYPDYLRFFSGGWAGGFSMGARVIGQASNGEWIWDFGEDVGRVLYHSSTAQLIAENGLTVFGRSHRITSADWGMTWNTGASEYDGAMGADHSIGPRSAIITPAGDIIVGLWGDRSLAEEFHLQRWAGGVKSSTDIEDYDTTDVDGEIILYNRQLLPTDVEDILYLESVSEIDPPSAGRYGTTEVFKNDSYPVAWSTADIPIHGMCADTFRGNPTMVAEDRVAIGNRVTYDGVVGDYSVMLLTVEGTTIANKSGAGATSVNGLGGTRVLKVLFDQVED